MLEYRDGSISHTYRHRQSEQLSHSLEPCEVPFRRIGTKRPFSNDVQNRRPAQSEISSTPGETPVKSVKKSIKKRRLGSDPISLYLRDAMAVPLLSKAEEQALTQKIFRYRRAFQRLILREPAVVKLVVDLLAELEAKQVRLDVVCNLGLSQIAKRKKLEPRIAEGLPSLRKIVRQMRQAASSATTNPAAKIRRWRKTIRIVESLMIRPHHLETAPFTNPRAEQLLSKYRELSQSLVLANTRLVVKIARQVCGNQSTDLMDMIQEGNRGLMHAVTKFDHRCHVRFSTYATPWIKQAIYATLPNSQRNIRIPENFRVIGRQLKKKVNELRQSDFELRHLDSATAIARLADEMQMDPLDVAHHLRIARDTCSLSQPFAGNSSASSSTDQGVIGASSLDDVLADSRDKGPGPTAETNERNERVHEMMSQALTRRERDVIRLRFGFGDGKDRSFAEVGREMGLTRQRVCQVEKQALEKLGKVSQRFDFAFV